MTTLNSTRRVTIHSLFMLLACMCAAPHTTCAQTQNTGPRPAVPAYTGEAKGKLSELKEVSGMVASRSQSKLFWAHEDSDNATSIYAYRLVTTTDLNGISTETPVLQARFAIKGKRVSNIDWEDMSIAPGEDGRDYLYVADFGNNARNRNGSRSRGLKIHRFPEPTVIPSFDGKVVSGTIEATKVETLFFTYPQVPFQSGTKTTWVDEFNAEALAVHPITKEICIFTKSHAGASDRNAPHSMLFFFTPAMTNGAWANQSTLDTATVPVVTAKFWGEITPQSDKVTGADFSYDGRKLVLLNYDDFIVYSADRFGDRIEYPTGETGMIIGAPIGAGRFFEPQAEAVFFARDGSIWVSSETSKRLTRFRE